MVESFENLDANSRNWELKKKDRVQKCLVEALSRYESLEEEGKSRFFSRK